MFVVLKVDVMLFIMHVKQNKIFSSLIWNALTVTQMIVLMIQVEISDASTIPLIIIWLSKQFNHSLQMWLMSQRPLHYPLRV